MWLNYNYLYKYSVSGYPEAYEKQSAAYFKELPFLIQKTIEQGKGIFKVAKKGAVNVWR